MSALINEPAFWSLLLAVFGAMWALIKVIGSQYEKREKERHENLTKMLNGLVDGQKEQQNALHKLERDFLKFQADIPNQYVRREDYAQSMATIMAKIDALNLKFDNMILRGSPRHEL